MDPEFPEADDQEPGYDYESDSGQDEAGPDDLLDLTPGDETPEEADEKTEPRPSRARERQQRRLERQRKQTEDAPRSIGHIVPNQINVSLPPVRIPRLRWLIGGVAGIVLVVVVVLVLRGINPPEIEAQPHALWLGTEWTYAVHEDAAINALIERLRANNIGTVYAWVSWLQEDATWRGTDNLGAVQQFASQLKAANPELMVYGWVSVPVNAGDDGYRLDDTDLQQSIADFSANVVNELGYDGVFLNVEPVWDGDEHFLNLLRRVRASVGDNVPVSAAVFPDWSPANATIPVPPRIVPGTAFAPEYKQSIALLTEQIVVMAYNSGLSTAADYEQWMAYQVRAFAEAISTLGAGTEIVIGIPTYDAELPAHDPLVENVDSAMAGFNAGLAAAGETAQFVRGVAIYADWETDEVEWAQFGVWLDDQ